MVTQNAVKKLFIRQSAATDCGLACLSMILKYGHLPGVADVLNIPVSLNGLSLVEMRNIAERHGLKTVCVKLDFPFLREISAPVILHVVNLEGDPHFIVCFGSRKKPHSYEYLVADPAWQVGYITEADLASSWQSRAGLFFSELDGKHESSPDLYHLEWRWLKLIPAIFWVILPLLSLFIALLGITYTWVIQKAINDAVIFSGGRITVVIGILLTLVLFCRAIITYLRGYLVMKMSSVTHYTMTADYLHSLVTGPLSKLPANRQTIEKDRLDILNIQLGLSTFVSALLGDGALVISMFALSIYLNIFTALPLIAYLLINGRMSLLNIPALLKNTTKLKELTALFDKELALCSCVNGASDKGPSNDQVKEFEQLCQAQLAVAREQSRTTSRSALMNECLGIITNMLIFGSGVFLLNEGRLSINAVLLTAMISYLITSLFPRICYSLLHVAKGADAWVMHRARISGYS